MVTLVVHGVGQITIAYIQVNPLQFQRLKVQLRRLSLQSHKTISLVMVIMLLLIRGLAMHLL